MDESEASKLFMQTSRNLEQILDIPMPKIQPKISYMSFKADNTLVHYLHSAKDLLQIHPKLTMVGIAGSMLSAIAFDPLQSIIAGSIGMFFSIHNMASIKGGYMPNSILLRLSNKEDFAYVASHEYAHFLQAHLSNNASNLQHIVHKLSSASYVAEGFAEACAYETLSLMGDSFKKNALLEKIVDLKRVIAKRRPNHYTYGATLMHIAIYKHGRSVLKEIAHGKCEALLAD